MTRTSLSIEPGYFCVAYFPTMAHREVSYSQIVTVMLVSHSCVVCLWRIISQVNKLTDFKRGGQSTNIVSIGNRNVRSKRIRSIQVSFVILVAIINGHERQIQIWGTTTNWKVVVESVINPHFVVLSIIFTSIILIPNITVVVSIKYSLCVTQYFYSAGSQFHISFIVHFFQALEYLPILMGQKQDKYKHCDNRQGGYIDRYYLYKYSQSPQQQ